MHVAFLDFMGIDYTVDTPRRRPIGGSQSAVCYLAERLAAGGWRVTLFNGAAVASDSGGVDVRPVADVYGDGLAGVDVAVVCGGSTMQFAQAMAARPGRRPFLAYWTGHMTDQAAVAGLNDPAFAALWDGFVFVSRWQADAYARDFAIPMERSVVIGNAVAPAFEAVARAGVPPLGARLADPVLVYTSTPFRGLDVLLAGFPRIRAAVPDVRLRVFSSMAVYGVPAGQDPYAPLYEQARATPGVEYVGAVDQPRLAEALRGAVALAYPNSFDETSCIAAMEAMAAGCVVASSERGALPETLAGFGLLMTPPADPLVHADHFAQMAVWLLTAARNNPAAFEARQRQQVAYTLEQLTWEGRARQWRDWLCSVLR
ncbi:glycosyltransferase family 4 protein [Azospirillum sp. TSO35-2]|uniref:glycosyltransferase family 4 protein n=1 Tax=Azospirillum sp. TSO35-2 TaxID=716796 RepID=UPI001304AE40|nr:glycosyltransferase family 4 protein [Azospirillum sp. TSO35-2]